MKVLIAENDPDLFAALENDIKELGHEVISANNGKDAWEVIQKGEVRLAFIDRMIPEIDGIEICRKTRHEIQQEKSKNIYIILITGKNNKDDILEGLSAGVDDYLTKPIDFVELKVRLQNGERIIHLEDSCIELSSYDRLTNLLKRDKILELLDEEIHRGWRENRPTGVILADIDYFKQINDTYGHFAGDKVLAEVALRVKNSIRPYDKAGRYGGDEILFVLPNCGVDIVKLVGERLCRSVNEKKIKTESALLDVTITLGGTSSDISSQTSRDNLINACDKALYLAKEQGRNRVVAADSTQIPVK